MKMISVDNQIDSVIPTSSLAEMEGGFGVTPVSQSA
jgi:hypothetical protein